MVLTFVKDIISEAYLTVNSYAEQSIKPFFADEFNCSFLYIFNEFDKALVTSNDLFINYIVPTVLTLRYLR